MRRSYTRCAAGMASVLAGLLLAAGCGGSSLAPGKVSGGTRGSRVAAISFTDPPVDPITAALVPKAVKSSGSVIVATDAAFPPDEFIGPDGHTIVGMDAELGRTLGDEMGITWNLVDAPVSGIVPGLRSGKFDIGLSSIRATPVPPKGITFVTYFSAGESFYVKAAARLAVTGLASLCGKSVAVAAGTVEQADVARQSSRCAAAGEPAVRVRVYAGQEKVRAAVAAGIASVAFVDSQIAGYLVRNSAGALRLSGPTINVALYAIAVPKASGLAPAILAALRSLTVDGVYTRILARWGMASGAITDPVINSAKS